MSAPPTPTNGWMHARMAARALVCVGARIFASALCVPIDSVAGAVPNRRFDTRREDILMFHCNQFIEDKPAHGLGFGGVTLLSWNEHFPPGHTNQLGSENSGASRVCPRLPHNQLDGTATGIQRWSSASWLQRYGVCRLEGAKLIQQPS